MNFTILKKHAGAALLAALCSSALPAAASEFSRLAEGLAAAASQNGITRVAMDAFTPAGSSVEEEARFASEKTAAELASGPGLQVLDLATLQAAAGGKESWLSRLPGRTRPQAIVKGTVFKEGDRVTVIARLVEAATGRVLSSMEAESRARFSEVPPVPDMDWGGKPSVAPVKDPFRDAPADNGFDCKAAFREMDRVNSGAVDLKARYWAGKMKEPGFVSGSLSRNPGSEIRDPQLKQQFYELLTKYFEAEKSPALPAGQTAKLEEFMGRESGVIDKCGIW